MFNYSDILYNVDPGSGRYRHIWDYEEFDEILVNDDYDRLGINLCKMLE